MEPRLTGVPSGSVAPQHVAPPPHCPPLPSTPMGDTIIRRSLAPGSTMDRGRSGLRLMFPWERVLPMPCLIYRVLLGNATWAKEAQPLSSQRALCSKSLNTTPGPRADRTAPPRSHYKPGSPKLGPKSWEHSLTCPHQAAPPTPGLSFWYPSESQHWRSVETQCPHRSASRPRIHPPYAILTWTPVLPEK